MLQLTGLWENTTKDGRKYLSGRLGNAKVMVFANTKKTDPKQPDYTLHLAEYERREMPSQGQTPQFEDSRGTGLNRKQAATNYGKIASQLEAKSEAPESFGTPFAEDAGFGFVEDDVPL